jgi:hypothetical protein
VNPKVTASSAQVWATSTNLADHTTWLDAPLPDERLAPVQEGVCSLDREALWTTRQAAVEGIGFVLQDASLRPPWKKLVHCKTNLLNLKRLLSGARHCDGAVRAYLPGMRPHIYQPCIPTRATKVPIGPEIPQLLRDDPEGPVGHFILAVAISGPVFPALTSSLSFLCSSTVHDRGGGLVQSLSSSRLM